MKTKYWFYSFILLNFPISIILLLAVLTTRRAEALEWTLSLLLGHYLFMGTVGSIIGLLVWARLVKIAGKYGESAAILDVSKNVTSQMIDDYNRYRRIKGDDPIAVKPWLDTYER